MKKIALLVFGIFFITLMGCDKDDTTTPVPSVEPKLTNQEILDLKFLREEEKLARDVYLYAFDNWNLNIHQKISGSEQKHMDMVLSILQNYDIEDPASPIQGVFNDTLLQGLYNDLILLCDISSTDALIAGMTIEDVDIRDLKLNAKNTDKQDLLDLYERLECGSRNHMRKFNEQLQLDSTSYTPQFITQEEFDSIINSSQEMCNM